MKKRKDEFSNSNTKYSIRHSKDNLQQKKSRFEYLYENSSIHDKRLELVRAKDYFKKQERMTPCISQKSKNLNRPKELFYKRLYKLDNTSSDISKLKGSKQEKEKTTMKSNNNIESSEEKDKNKIIKEEENLYIKDNKKKNDEFKKYYNLPNFKSRNTTFLFKPKINNKSKLIASKLKTSSSERLFTLSLKQKENLNVIFLKKRKEKEKKLKLEKEKQIFKMNNYTYKPNIKNNKRKWVDKLYEKGINSIKKREEEIKKEKLLNEKEYLQYPYSPVINHNNYSYSYINKSNNISINSSNTKVYQKRIYRNNSLNRMAYNQNSKFNKTTVYERNINWKKLIDKKREELKKRISNDNSLTLEESFLNQQSNKEIMNTDISFIKKNYIEYETFLDRYNYKLIKKNLDKINYRKKNIPPKKIYAKN